MSPDSAPADPPGSMETGRRATDTGTGSIEGERRSAERRSEDRRKLERIGIFGLIAILVAGAAVILAIVAVWRQAGVNTRIEALQAEQAAIASGTQELRQKLTLLAEQAAEDARRNEELSRLSAQFGQLNETIESLRERAESGQRALLRDEARFLLEMAGQRLALERDVTGAIAALRAADERLAAVRDPRLAGVRRRLALETQSLHMFPQPDLAGVAARLAAAEELAPRLPVMGAVTSKYEPEDRLSGVAPGLERAWQVVKSSLRDMISIRRIGKDAVELVSLEEQGVRRHHLQLLLFSARLSAMRGDEPGFRAALTNARSWLMQMFDKSDPNVIALADDIDELLQLDIAPPLPDISGSLQLLQRLEPRSPSTS